MSSLKEMMSALHAMEQMQDDSPEITEDMIMEHFQQVTEIDQKVDNVEKFMQMCRQNAALYSERAEALNAKAKHFEKALKNCENYVLWLLGRYPDVEFRGSEVQFKRKINPPSMKCSFAASKSFSGVIHPEAVSEIPEKYREPRVVWQLKSSDVKKALGHEENDVEFATLERSERLVVEYKLKEEK